MKHLDKVAWIFVIAALLLGSFTVYWLVMPKQTEIAPVAADIAPTVVCGSYASPAAVAGVPTEASETTITFADGYLLRLKQPPSLFLERRALFDVTDGLVTRYGLVKAEFNPCPQK